MHRLDARGECGELASRLLACRGKHVLGRDCVRRVAFVEHGPPFHASCRARRRGGDVVGSQPEARRDCSRGRAGDRVPGVRYRPPPERVAALRVGKRERDLDGLGQRVGWPSALRREHQRCSARAQ